MINKDLNRPRKVNIVLSPEVHKQLKLASVQSDRLLKDFARSIIETHFSSRKSNEKA